MAAVMENTPTSMRKYIGIFGRTNAGKSSLFNALLGQAAAIVSEVGGTTTDPVSKAMEIVGYGAVTLVDTAGYEDISELGEKRTEKTDDIKKRCDLAILVEDISLSDRVEIDLGNTPVLRVYTKCDKISKDVLAKKISEEPDNIYIFSYSDDEISTLHKKIAELLSKQNRDDDLLLRGVLKSGDTVVLVIPIDAAAPRGRLILPQVQTIRACIEQNITAICTSPNMLGKVLAETCRVDLVITDSQAFDEVARIVPDSIKLTSFSMLLANQSGRIKQLIEGTRAISDLKDNDNILMLEACTHNTTHEDIGRVKIPQLLKKVTGKNLKFTFLTGYDFSEEISKYSLIIQCGGCMINRKTVQNRLMYFERNNAPVTNYGVVLAYLNGILDRASEVFLKNN